MEAAQRPYEASYLESLPDELLLLIFQRLGKADLLHLAQVSRKISRSTPNCLYKTPEICSKYDGDVAIQFLELLRTLREQPQFAKILRHLKVPFLRQDHSLELETPDTTMLKEAASFLKPTQLFDDMSQTFNHEGNDHATALILSYATAIESLMLAPDYFCFPRESNQETIVDADLIDDTLTLKLITRSASLRTPDGQPILSRLRTILLVSNDREEPTSASTDDETIGRTDWTNRTVSLFFQHPSLATFIASKLFERHLHSADWICSPQTSTIHTIHLQDCEINSSTVRQAILSCKRLETFVWSTPCKECRADSMVTDLREIYPALETHSASLSTLRLFTSCDCNQNTHIATLEDPQPIPSLPSFSSLQFLEVSETHLSNTTELILPSHIRDLIIHGEHRESLAIVIRAAVACKEKRLLRCRVWTEVKDHIWTSWQPLTCRICRIEAKRNVVRGRHCVDFAWEEREQGESVAKRYWKRMRVAADPYQLEVN